MASSRMGRIALLLCSVSIVAGCEKGNNFNFLKKKDPGAEVSLGAGPSTSSVKLVERDIEAPEVFEAIDQGLWDGRPSLGGVWVAHPDVTEPERVIIRNVESGKFVIGALFKRERENPGPKLQVSSDAAAALGMLAGAPDQLNVTALRRQEVPIANETVDGATETLPAVEEIQTAALDPIAAAGAALDKVEATAPAVASATPAAAPVKPAAPAPTASRLDKPFIQIGLFSVEENANNTGAALRNAGILPTVKRGESRGKTYYRVTVGPANTASERASVLKKIKGLGYTDAYFVTN
ncbi:MAG: SPOR domain-containing protein [Rhodobacter sp.]|nr:SPOR domain-containing protein [Rhodobacter sp.]